MNICNLKVLVSCLVVLVVLLTVSFVLAFKILPDVIYDEINKAVQLQRGTEQFDRFEKLPFPLDFKAYIFNVNNPQDILFGAKPNVTEVGPFLYNQYREKDISYIDSDEDSITYTQNQDFEFTAENTIPENSTYTILNAPLMSLLTITEDILFLLPPLVYDCVLPTFQKEEHRNLFIVGSVRELLFDGIPFCKMELSTPECYPINMIVCAIAATKRNVETDPTDNSLKFSFLNFKNGKDDGKYAVKRGFHPVSELGHIIRWNDEKFTNYWGENSTCSEVKGADSTIYPPRVKTDESFFIFSTDICRSVQIDYLKKSSYKGISAYEFGTDENTLRSSHANATEDCYCIKQTKDINGEENCYLDGLIDMNTCFGVPVLLSWPHFLWADEKYKNAVDGLNPQEDKHRIFLTIEPNTGTPLQGIKRIQINMVLRPIIGITPLDETTRVVLPLIWIEEGVQLTQKYIDELNTSYFSKVALVDGVRWGLISLFSVLIVIVSGFLIKKKCC